ncbi:MAG: response regulator [candidate division KSB1 bacterium]|nr:response regulator [candidate division KSB1 bacterium]MDZ7367163.1 response regulator [candidate division KSB1 bacterium]MDZ7405354.1 response regulator [candidate division KSB1 bacterium]
MEASKPKILIVDDRSNWRTTLETLLKSYGYAVTVAANVLEASEALEQGPYNTAILDVRLDDFDDENREGLSTVLLSAHLKYPRMSFIVISSYYSEAEVRDFAPPDVRLFYFDKNNFPIDKMLNTLEQLVLS